MSQSDSELFERAVAVAANAYAPYSSSWSARRCARTTAASSRA